MDDSSRAADGGTGSAGDGLLTSRRTFLAAVGAASVAVGAAGGGFAQAQTYRLGGEVAGWQGREPQSIAGTTNPTLELQAGQQYEIVWENLDGQPHNVVIEDGQGNDLVRSDIMDQQGQTQTVTFTAAPEMASYYCEVHPSSMRGQVSVSGGTGTPTGTGTGTETGTPSGGAQFFAEGPSVGVQRVASGPLVNPTGLHSVPGQDDMRLVLDQMGQIYAHTADGLQEEPFLDLSDRITVLTDAEGGFDRPEGFDERGLLGLAFDPNFEGNRQFYVRYSAPDAAADDGLAGPPGREMPDNWDHVEVLAEFTAADDLSGADPASERVLLEIPSPQFNHNSGDVAFGPDGYLYMGIGDGGGADDTGIGHVEDWYEENAGGNGQDTEANLLGSILRLDVSGAGADRPYAIPDDNPLVDGDGFGEQYAWGFRNPWRFSFNDGLLVVADVGQNLFEEVDLVEAGGNYGWNVKEGTHCFSTANPNQPPEECPTTGPQGEPLIDPVVEYPHQFQGQSVGISVTGGYVYQGDAISELQGEYVFGDWSASFSEPRGSLLVASPPGAGTVSQIESPGGDMWEVQELVVEGGENGEINRFITSFARDADGEIYVLTSETGRLTDSPGEVYKLVPPGEGQSVSPPGTPTPTATGTGTPTGAGTPTGTGTEMGTPTGAGTPGG